MDNNIYGQKRIITSTVVVQFCNMVGYGLDEILTSIKRDLRSEDGQAVDLADAAVVLGNALNAFSHAAVKLIENDPNVKIQHVLVDENGNKRPVASAPDQMTDNAYRRLMRHIHGTGSDS